MKATGNTLHEIIPKVAEMKSTCDGAFLSASLIKGSEVEIISTVPENLWTVLIQL